MRLTRTWLALFLVLLAAPAGAEEPRGCDKFAWNIDKDRELLLAAVPTDPASLSFSRDGAVAHLLRLVPDAQAKLVLPPERVPKDANSFAGLASFAAGKDATYRVSLSEAAWIDIIQNGSYVKSGRFTGALDCPGIRKSVESLIGAGPFDLQLSGAATNEIGVLVAPAQ